MRIHPTYVPALLTALRDADAGVVAFSEMIVPGVKGCSYEVTMKAPDYCPPTPVEDEEDPAVLDDEHEEQAPAVASQAAPDADAPAIPSSGPARRKQAAPKKSDAEYRAEALTMRERCWAPELVDQAIRQANTVGPKVTPKQALDLFYAPAFQYQEWFDDATLTRPALEAARDAEPMFSADAKHRWWKYLRGTYLGKAVSKGMSAKTDEGRAAVETYRKRKGYKKQADAELVAIEKAAVESKQQQLQQDEDATWLLNANRLLGFVAKHGVDHPKLGGKLLTVIEDLAQAAMTKVIDDGGSADDANQAHREAKERLTAGIDRKAKSWAEVAGLPLAGVAADPFGESAEPGAEAIKALGQAGARRQHQPDVAATPQKDAA